jgi:hypothetical protein
MHVLLARDGLEDGAALVARGLQPSMSNPQDTVVIDSLPFYSTLSSACPPTWWL